MAGPLSGVRVLDFGRYVAGPFVAAMLGDMGADVLRVERIGGGEDRLLFPVSDEVGALFLQVNRNKRGMTLDAKTPGGREIFEKLVAGADVVVANMPADSLRDMGLDYASLKKLKPDVILGVVAGFGPGPYETRVAFDSIGQAMSGAAYMSGPPGHPTKSAASWVDFSTAMMATLGIVAAVHEKSRSGRGQEVSCSLLETALTVFNYNLIEETLMRRGRVSTHNRAQAGGPVDFVRTRDGWIAVHVISDALFRRFARMVDEPGLLDDPRFATDETRGDNNAALAERLQEWAKDYTTQEALAALAKARLPAGPVLSPAQTMQDRHVRESGAFTPMDYPGLPQPAPVAMRSMRFSETPVGIWRRPPMVGEHTDEVLGELGYSSAAIAAFRDSGAI